MPPSDDQLKQHVTDNARLVVDIVAELLKATGGPSPSQALRAAEAGGDYVARAAGFQSTWSMAIAVLDAVLGGFVKILGKIREAGVEGLPDLTAEVLNEFLGTEFTGEHFGVLTGKDATLVRARQIGEAVLGRLEKEFVPEGTVDAKSAEVAAQRMAGFAINFGIQTGVLALLGGAVPIAHLDEVREMGVQAAQNIGLGRLVRRALQPLIQETISTPYGRALKARYQQDLLAPHEYIRAYLAGRLDRDTLLKNLHQHGFTEADIDELTKQQAPDLNMLEEARLERYGELTRDQIIQDLRDRGWTADYAAKRARADALSRVDAEWNKYLALIEQQYTKRLIDQDSYNKLLDRAPLYAEEAQIYRDRAGQALEVPSKFPTWAQVTTLYEIGAVDLDYVDTWLTREGYSADDNLNLTLLLLYKFGQAQKKEQAKAAKDAAKAAKLAGQPSTPPPAPPAPLTPPIGGTGQP